jgi:hypothetical protein
LQYAPPDPNSYKILPIIQNQPCDAICYTPGHETDPECQYCVFVNPQYPKNPYKVPKNVFVMAWTDSSSCFEQSTMNDWNFVETATATYHGSSGYFSWHSSVTEHFLYRYYRDYASLALFAQRYIYHTLTLFPSQTLDDDFLVRISLLPTEFNATTKSNFFDFITNYGTHYIDSAYMGGIAILESYFHSCMLTSFSGEWIYKESGSSFFGIFNSEHQHWSGYNHTSKDYMQYSNSSVTLYGGNGADFGTFNWSRKGTANESAAWAATIYQSQVPVLYHITPMPEIFPSQFQAQAYALNDSIEAYFQETGSNNTQEAQGFAPRDETTPSWCKNPGWALRGVPRIDNQLLTDDPNPQPAPLPPCPDLDLEGKLLALKQEAEAIELSRELGIDLADARAKL